MDTNLQITRKKLFDPDEPEIESFGCFTLAEARKSIFGSTRYHPVPVHVSNYHNAPDTMIPVALDLARPIFAHDQIGDSDHPDWYFEGVVLTYGREAPWRVRIYVMTRDTPEFDMDDIFTWQKIRGQAPGDQMQWLFH